MRRSSSAFALLLLLAFPPAAGADEPAAPAPPQGEVRIGADVDVKPTGDLTAKLRIRFHASDYDRVKQGTPDAKKFLQDMAPARADYQLAPGAKSTYDDAAHSIVITATELGGAKNRGEGRWETKLEEGMEVAKEPVAGTPRPVVVLSWKGEWDNGVKFAGRQTVSLPVGAKNSAYDPETRLLSWELPFQGGTGDGRIAEPTIFAKDRLMASTYKVYGFGSEFAAHWVAKTVWKNVGTNAVRNLRVRYRVEKYADWSPWDKYPEVVPGQTVVSVYYPVFDASIAKVRSNTPADLRIEWRWEDAQGKIHEDDGAKRLILLGVNEFVFSNLGASESFGTWAEAFNNAPLLAAWVSRNDPVVKQFAAMANRMAGGVGATTNDESAVRVLQACYDLLRGNDFTYQHPPSLADKQLSFDVKAVQNVKFPRDVIRDRSGTCIDLAILYASMANALGLDPYLALIPGHCFPFVKLPSGAAFSVEATGIGGGLRYGSADFDRAQQIGNKELADARADGRIFEVEVRDNWTKGVSNPELEDFPADILQRWGLKEAEMGAAPSGPAAPAPTGLDAILGLWGGALNDARLNDDLSIDEAVLGFERSDAGVWRAGVRLEFLVQSGTERVRVRAVGIYEDGKADGKFVRFRPVKLKRTILSTGAESEFDGNPLAVSLTGDGRIEAVFEGEGGFTLTLAPKKVDAPAPGPTPPAQPSGIEKLAGSWGGPMGGKDIGSGTLLDEMYVDASRGADGAWSATVKMKCTVPAGGGTKVVVDAVYGSGRVDGATVVFDKVPWHRTVPSSGQKDDLDGNPLVLSLTAEGALQGVFGGDDGLSFTLARRK
jgi:hypothetical protein